MSVFKKGNVFIYWDRKRPVFQRENCKKWVFSYETTSKLLKRNVRILVLVFFFFLCFPLLPSLTFWRYTSVGPVAEYPLWGLSVHTHLVSDAVGKMQQAYGTVWELWNPIRESSLWPSPWLMALFLSAAEAVSSISINCTGPVQSCFKLLQAKRQRLAGKCPPRAGVS